MNESKKTRPAVGAAEKTLDDFEGQESIDGWHEGG